MILAVHVRGSGVSAFRYIRADDTRSGTIADPVPTMVHTTCLPDSSASMMLSVIIFRGCPTPVSDM